MLVLSRQRDETIMIGDEVEVTIVDIRGDKVRLGISAPRHVAVHRKEVYEAIKRENRAAAEVRPEDLAPPTQGGGSGGGAGALKGGPLRPTVRATLQPVSRPGRGQRREASGGTSKRGGSRSEPSADARAPEAKPMPADEPPPVPPPAPDESAS